MPWNFPSILKNCDSDRCSSCKFTQFLLKMRPWRLKRLGPCRSCSFLKKLAPAKWRGPLGRFKFQSSKLCGSRHKNAPTFDQTKRRIPCRGGSFPCIRAGAFEYFRLKIFDWIGPVSTATAVIYVIECRWDLFEFRVYNI